MNKANSKLFYGWVIVAAGSVINGSVMGIIFNCFSQYVKPVCADLGFTRQAMAMNLTLITVTQAVLSFVWGWLLKRFDLKRLMVVIAVLGSLGYYGYSLSTELWMFYLCSIVCGAAMTLLTILPFTYIISNWFIEKRGLAMGVCFMGSGVGGMICNYLLGVWLQTHGWRVAFRLLALVIAATAIPGTLLLKIKPEDMGLRPLGFRADAGEAAAREEGGMTLAQARKTAAFWVLALCIPSINMVIVSTSQVLSPHMTDNGYPLTLAAAMVSVCMGALAVGKIVVGRVYDVLGTKRSSVASLFCAAAGFAGILLCQYPWALALVVIGVGFGCPIGNIGYPLMIQSLFGKRDFSAIMGKLSAFGAIGTSLSPIINGASYDRFGDYRPAFLLWLAVTAATLVGLLVILPADRKSER